MESFTAKGLKLEYISRGEKIMAKTNKKPKGPSNGLYHDPLPSYFALKISASHLDLYIRALIS